MTRRQTAVIQKMNLTIDTYVTFGSENGPKDAICLYLVKMWPLPTTSWQPACPHPAGVLLVLAMPVNNLLEMVGDSASYSPNSC